MLCHLTDVFVNTGLNHHFCLAVIPLKTTLPYFTNYYLDSMPLRYRTETVPK